MDEFDEIVDDFLVESREGLESLDQHLLALEAQPDDLNLITEIFRVVHTIKGTTGFLGFSNLEAVTHVGESLLSGMRDGNIKATPDITTALLTLVDVTRTTLDAIEANGSEPDDEHKELIALLEGFNGGPSAEPAAAPAAVEAPVEPAVEAPVESTIEATVEAAPAADGNTPFEITYGEDDDALAVTGEPGAEPSWEEIEAAFAAHNAKLAEMENAAAEASAASAVEPEVVAEPVAAVAKPEPVVSIAPTPAAPKPKDAADAPQRSISDATLRIRVDLLDHLMNLVGELVLTRNRIRVFAGENHDAPFGAACQQLDLVTGELQEGLMKARMQPISAVWKKFPRVVRDLAITCGKQINLEMVGTETELDKTLIESIKDPLTHLIRNAVDHGIESPEKRKASGKSETGTLTLRAYHEGGLVNIEISDDGGGIPPAKIKAKAVERGLITQADAQRMRDAEIVNLIFAPGFSTAEAVTNVSGRGVGMDVVKTNIERIGGVIDVSSAEGKGSIFSIKLPLTLAIVPALLVSTGGDRYAIPQVSLVELVRLAGERSTTAIEKVHNTPVIRHRGRLLPLVYLDRQLQINDPDAEPPSVINIIVLQAAGRQFGLVVDKIQDTEEIVVKPLGERLRGIKPFAGATVMGDGRIALILDILGLAQQANVVSEDGAGIDADDEDQENTNTQRRKLLLFETSDGNQLGMPLPMVNRLERFKHGSIERIGSHEVVHYRGGLLPMVKASDALGAYSSMAELPNDETLLDTVVLEMDGRRIGFVVDKIIDIIEEEIQVGEQGSAHVVRGRATQMVDVQSVMMSVSLPEFGADVEKAA